MPFIQQDELTHIVCENKYLFSNLPANDGNLNLSDKAKLDTDLENYIKSIPKYSQSGLIFQNIQKALAQEGKRVSVPYYDVENNVAVSLMENGNVQIRTSPVMSLKTTETTPIVIEESPENVAKSIVATQLADNELKKHYETAKKEMTEDLKKQFGEKIEFFKSIPGAISETPGKLKEVAHDIKIGTGKWMISAAIGMLHGAGNAILNPIDTTISAGKKTIAGVKNLFSIGKKSAEEVGKMTTTVSKIFDSGLKLAKTGFVIAGMVSVTMAALHSTPGFNSGENALESVKKIAVQVVKSNFEKFSLESVKVGEEAIQAKIASVEQTAKDLGVDNKNVTTALKNAKQTTSDFGKVAQAEVESATSKVGAKAGEILQIKTDPAKAVNANGGKPVEMVVSGMSAEQLRIMQETMKKAGFEGSVKMLTPTQASSGPLTPGS